jgi:hypothetical protein
MEPEAYSRLHYHLSEAFKALTQHADEVAVDTRLIQVARLLTQAQEQLCRPRDEHQQKTAS